MQSTTGFGTFCAMTLTAAGLLFMPAAYAQQQSPSGPSSATPSPTTAPTNIPDKKLDAAAAAVKKVSARQGHLRTETGPGACRGKGTCC